MIDVSIQVVASDAARLVQALENLPPVSVVQLNGTSGDLSTSWVLVSGEMTADDVDEWLFDHGWDDSVHSVEAA